LLFLKRFRRPVLILFAVCPLAAQIPTAIQRCPLSCQAIMRNEDYAANTAPFMGVAPPRPISGTVSVARLRHTVPGKAVREFDRAEQESEKGHAELSISHLKKAIHIDPAYMEAHNNLGCRYGVLGDYEHAADEFRIALQLDPSSVFAHTNVAQALYLLNRYPDAEQAARRALQLDANFIKAHYILGLILSVERNTLPEAAEHLEKSAGDFPTALLLLEQMRATLRPVMASGR